MESEVTTEEKLEGQARETCQVTWNDADTKKRIKEIAEDATISIKSKLGMAEGDDVIIFLTPGKERRLWKNLVLYMWNNMEEDFDKNYLSEIAQVRRKYEVKYAEKEAESI